MTGLSCFAMYGKVIEIRLLARRGSERPCDRRHGAAAGLGIMTAWEVISMTASHTKDRIDTYAEFWPYYLKEHEKPGTRVLHYIGTALVIATAIYAVFAGWWWLLLLLPILGYGFAWAGHALVERNKPATFTYPLWSLISDFRMFFVWISGQLPKELRKAGVKPGPV
jgi:hypothetical protein